MPKSGLISKAVLILKEEQSFKFFQQKSTDIFLIYPQNNMLWYSTEASLQGTSNEYHNIYFCGEKWEKYYANTPYYIWSYVEYHLELAKAGLHPCPAEPRYTLHLQTV